jgi:hypothetical protein
MDISFLILWFTQSHPKTKDSQYMNLNVFQMDLINMVM